MRDDEDDGQALRITVIVLGAVLLAGILSMLACPNPAKAAPAPTVGDCIARFTNRVSYLGCDATIPGQWPIHNASFNASAIYVPFGTDEVNQFRARYGHEIRLSVAVALGKPSSIAECGTPVGERYSDDRVYARLSNVCPELPSSYHLTLLDQNDLVRAVMASGQSFYDANFPPLGTTNPPVNPPPVVCPTCPACPVTPALLSVPASIRATVNAAPGWLPTSQKAKRAQLVALAQWLAQVQSYHPGASSTALMELKLYPCDPQSSLRECLGVAP